MKYPGFQYSEDGEQCLRKISTSYFKYFIFIIFIYLKNVLVQIMVMVVIHHVNVFMELVIQMQQMIIKVVLVILDIYNHFVFNL